LFISIIKQNIKQKIKPKEKGLREGINKCEEVIKQLEVNSTTTQTQINELFNKIRIKLNEKEQELLSKLDEIEKYKKKELEIQKEELKFGIKSIIGSCQIIENSISLSNNNNNENYARLLSMKKFYESRLDYLSNNIWKIEPCCNPFIEFWKFENEEKSIYSSVSNLAILDSNEISIEKCLISRNENQVIMKDSEFEFEFISYSKEGNQMKKGGNEKQFKVQIFGELKNEDNGCEILDLNNGRYEVKILEMEIINLMVHGKSQLIQKEISLFQITITIEFKYLIQEGNLFQHLDHKEMDMVSSVAQKE